MIVIATMTKKSCRSNSSPRVSWLTRIVIATIWVVAVSSLLNTACAKTDDENGGGIINKSGKDGSISASTRGGNQGFNKPRPANGSGGGGVSRGRTVQNLIKPQEAQNVGPDNNNNKQKPNVSKRDAEQMQSLVKQKRWNAIRKLIERSVRNSEILRELKNEDMPIDERNAERRLTLERDVGDELSSRVERDKRRMQNKEYSDKVA